MKNHQSKGSECAKRLPAPFKLAITGTPMENNLAELWSLLLDHHAWPLRPAGPLHRVLPPPDRERTRRRRGWTSCADGSGRSCCAAARPTWPPTCRAKQEQVVELDSTRSTARSYQTYLQRERQKVLGLLGDLDKNRFEIFRSLTLLRQAEPRRQPGRPHTQAVPSTKLDVLVEQLTDIAAEGHRTLVFSQFTRFLARRGSGWSGRASRARISTAAPATGPTSSTSSSTATAPVFLISLKAGGFGLNLTEADYCILLDPWWNPATEAQAVDRVHRIGQTRNVMVYRLVAKDTIEEKVMALRRARPSCSRSVMDDGDFADARLSAADIRALLA